MNAPLSNDQRLATWRRLVDDDPECVGDTFTDLLGIAEQQQSKIAELSQRLLLTIHLFEKRGLGTYGEEVAIIKRSLGQP